MKKGIGAFLILGIGTLYPATLEVTPASQGATAACQSTSGCVAALDLVINQLKADFQNLEVPDVSNLSRGTLKASILSQRGAGVDYASEFDIFSLSFGPSLGVKPFADLFGGSIGADLQKGNVPEIGASAITPITIGLNLGIFPIPKIGFFDPKKATGFFSIQAFSFSSLISNLTDGSLEVDSFNIGLNLQYEIVERRSLAVGRLFYWGGLDITTGLNYSSFSIKMKDTWQAQDSGAKVEGEAKVGLKAWALSIPVEVSSNIQLLYILTLYGGLGISFNAGKGEFIPPSTTLDGYYDIDGDNQLEKAYAGEAKLVIDGSASSHFLLFYPFVGAQLNLWILKVRASIFWSVEDTASLQLMAGIAW